MLNREWWKLPSQIAMGLLLANLFRAIIIFILRALGAGGALQQGFLN